MVVRRCYLRRYGWHTVMFRVGRRHGAVYLPHRSWNLCQPATIWWRTGAEYVNGPGWMVCFFMRKGDYRPFSERQGLVPVRHVGPLTIKRLEAS